MWRPRTVDLTTTARATTIPAMAVVSRAVLEVSLADLRSRVSDPREGILGPRSRAWTLGADLGLFIGGGRAALLQLAHPKVAYAIEQHSLTRTDVVGRFRRTFHNVFAMLFGDLEQAFTAARRVHTVHTQVHGRIPDAIGRWPAGTEYHANDPESLCWVHATLVDTTIKLHELLHGELPRAVKDDYIRELHRFAALFGIPPAMLPQSWAEHTAYMDEMLGSDLIAVAPCARAMAGFLVGRGGRDERAQPALGRITEAVTHALLPGHLAEQFGLRGAPRRTRAGLAAFATVYRRLPSAAIRVPARTEAQHRLDGRGPSRVAAWTERQLFGLARRATGRAS